MTQFSLIIACYKQEQFIRETVDSALELPYPDKEIIVVDDASPDRTAQILEEYGDKIRLIKHEKNLGANVGRNEAPLLPGANTSSFSMEMISTCPGRLISTPASSS
jgi:glycosyltransferase involved in cell wall biosynthesis